MFELASQPQGIGRSLDNGFRLFFKGIGPAALLLLVMIIAAAVLVAIFGVQVMMTMAQMGQVEPGQAPPMEGIGAFILFIIALYVIIFVFQNAMTAKYGSIAYNRDMGIGGAIATGFKKLIPIIIYYIMYSLIVGAAALPLIILMAVLQPEGITAAIIIIVGMIPPMIFMLSLMMGTYLIIIDNVGIFEAIGRSHKLVWGNWWRTALYLTVIMVILAAIVFAIMFAFGFLMAFLMSSAGENMTMMIVFQAVNQMVSFAFMPAMIALMIPYYHDLKLRKEGGDLAAKISAA